MTGIWHYSAMQDLTPPQRLAFKVLENAVMDDDEQFVQSKCFDLWLIMAMAAKVDIAMYRLLMLARMESIRDEKETCMNFVEIDLKRVIEDIGIHYSPTCAGEYTSACPVCGESIAQTCQECPVCETPVIWIHSKIWQGLYGSPAAAKRELSIILPQKPAEIMALKQLGLRGFAYAAEQRRFQEAAAQLSDDRIRGMVQFVCREHRGRAGLQHLVNWMKKEAKGKRNTKTVLPAEVDLASQI